MAEGVLGSYKHGLKYLGLQAGLLGSDGMIKIKKVWTTHPRGLYGIRYQDKIAELMGTYKLS